MELADKGYNLAPDVKAGIGLFSFVDYGQPIAGESGETIVGNRITDLMKGEVDPTALTFIGEAMGRVFYRDASQGVVYYSEIDRFNQIDPNNYIYFRDAGLLTAVESLHGYLLMLFAHKTVILDAKTGLDETWSLVQELNGVGCCHRDAVTRHESVVFWMGSGSVWAWDGSGPPERISAAIEYPSFSSDMNYQANENPWLAVDPAKKELLVYMGLSDWTSGWGELYFEDTLALRGKCMVYSMGQKTWSTETYRAFRAPGEAGYKYLGKPWTLDNHLLIPASDTPSGNYKYLIVRQSYLAFIGPGDGTHDTYLPPWKRAVLETGFIDLGSVAHDKKLKRLHTAFTGPLLFSDRASAPIHDDALDHWTAYLYQTQEWEDALSTAPWMPLSDLTADYTWDVNAEAGDGYTRSVYTKNNLPSRPCRYVAIRLESAGYAGTTRETLATKAEIGDMALSYSLKERF